MCVLPTNDSCLQLQEQRRLIVWEKQLKDLILVSFQNELKCAFISALSSLVRTFQTVIEKNRSKNQLKDFFWPSANNVLMEKSHDICQDDIYFSRSVEV